jgi:acetolactate synthase-1/2/3 large subunit
MSRYTVSDLIAEFLAAMDLRTAFGIASVHNIPMLDAISRRNALRFISVRGEMGGGHMADAYSRISGGIGLLVTSTGPGCANALSALVEANFASSRLLHITGRTATRFLYRDTGSVHDVPGQSAMLAAAGKGCFQVKRPEDTLGILMRAVSEILSPPSGPITVEIPIDLQMAEIERPEMLDLVVRTAPAQTSPADSAIEGLARMVTDSRRPMIWLGNGARAAGPAARRLLDLGFGCVTSWNGRGIVPEDHPSALGAMQGSGTPEIETFYDSVDLLIVAGSRLRGHETLEQRLRLPSRRVQIDVDPLAVGRTYSCEAFVHGDASLTLERLADRLEVEAYAADSALQGDLVKARGMAAAAYRDTLGPYRDFSDQLRTAMPRDAVFVRDATVAANTWGHRLFPVYGPRDSVHSVGAAIGLGLPFGIGAAIAAGEEGRKVVALVGDGGFALSLSELWVAVQENVDLTIIVMNDGIYAAIGHMQDALVEGRRNYLDLLVPDLLDLANLAGVPAFRVSQVSEFGSAVSRAIAVDGPALVDVDMRSIGDVPAYASWGGGPGARPSGTGRQN